MNHKRRDSDSYSNNNYQNLNNNYLQNSQNLKNYKFDGDSVKGSYNPLKHQFLNVNTQQKNNEINNNINKSSQNPFGYKNNYSSNYQSQQMPSGYLKNYEKKLQIESNFNNNNNFDANNRPYSAGLGQIQPHTTTNSNTNNNFKNNVQMNNYFSTASKTNLNNNSNMNNNTNNYNNPSSKIEEEDDSPIKSKLNQNKNFYNINNNNNSNEMSTNNYNKNSYAVQGSYQSNLGQNQKSNNTNQLYKSEQFQSKYFTNQSYNQNKNNNNLNQNNLSSNNGNSQKQQNGENQNQYKHKKQQSLSLTSQNQLQLQQFQQPQQSCEEEQQQQEKKMFENDQPLPNHEPTKCSFKRNGIVKAYAANTNQGLVRNYNEDRVSIILNIMKPASRENEEWPKCSFFGVYDGHGGVACADFLRDNLHQYVIKEPSFPWNPKEALKKGFANAEAEFLERASNPIKNNLTQHANNPNKVDRSGSCAIVVLIVGDMCYVANVGDSRAVLSGSNGAKTYTLSRDHKPTDEQEQQRIVAAGGKIYQTQAQTMKQGPDNKQQVQQLLGPLRVFPGRLSVSRTFGDIEAKQERFGGNPKVVVADPEIKSFKITDDQDFVVLGSDGIFDKLTSRECNQQVWNSAKFKQATIHKQCGLGVEYILRESMNQKSLDNITVVMIAFQNYKKYIFGGDTKTKENLKEQQKQYQQKQQSQMQESIQQQQGVKKQQILAESQNYNNYKTQNQNIGNQLRDTTNTLQNSVTSSLQISSNNYNKNKNNNINKYGGEENIYKHSSQHQNQKQSNLDQMMAQRKSVQNNFMRQSAGMKENNLNSLQQQNQMNNLKMLDQKITEISSKVNNFSLFNNNNNNNLGNNTNSNRRSYQQRNY